MAPHQRSVRVYLEDTDAQGVVYHTNYLKYCERSRTDILLEQGFRLADLQDQGWTLVVHEMTVKYRRPARLHDELAVRSTARRKSDYRISFTHEVSLKTDGATLLTANVEVVAIDDQGGLRTIPEHILTTPVA